MNGMSSRDRINSTFFIVLFVWLLLILGQRYEFLPIISLLCSLMENIVSVINKVVWNPGLVVLLLLAGLYFSVRTRMVQVRRLGLMFRSLFGKKRGKDGIRGVHSVTGLPVQA